MWGGGGAVSSCHDGPFWLTFARMRQSDRKVAVIGLGYVGLPVAVAFGRTRPTIGFDINPARVAELKSLKEGTDKTGEVTATELREAHLEITGEPSDLKKADFFIVAVPTPVDEAKRPDLRAMLSASETVARVLKKGDVVVYESTVYPGATEEACLPVLERVSGLRGGVDFFVGYSPERINPGDPQHKFTSILKVVAGQTPEALELIAEVYGSVVKAGVHRAPSIRVAEAAKVIENTQRDLNIALMNELAILFDAMGISTRDVLEAASTKWNFLKFKPGLVGGHCIGVDPYYLTHQAERYGYIPQVILAGRRINDGMGKFIAARTVKELIRAGQNVMGCTVTILGLTFKEDCPDLRNSKVEDIIRELREFGVKLQIHDPIADAREARADYGVDLVTWEKLQPAHAVITAVAHRQYRELDVTGLKRLMLEPRVLIDVKAIHDRAAATAQGVRYWSL